MTFPQKRMRRLRSSPVIRRLVRETSLGVGDLVYPIFVKEAMRGRRAIPSMPGQFQHAITSCVKEAQTAWEDGIRSVLLFGIPRLKDPSGSSAFEDRGAVQEAVRLIKKKIPKLLVITDVCLCEYTTHGHCGVLKGTLVDNDATLELLAKTALSHARAGADIVAPSDMMDGRVRAIRETLDRHGLQDIPIMSYAAKYASAFYAPFRDAAENPPAFGDRSTYQMDPANVQEALEEVRLDIDEGADLILVKPMLAYLDVVRRVSQSFICPVGCYNVSGEYTLVKAAAARGWIEERRTVLEMLLSAKRAGARFIVTYWAKDAAKWLKRSNP